MEVEDEEGKGQMNDSSNGQESPTAKPATEAKSEPCSRNMRIGEQGSYKKKTYEKRMLGRPGSQQK